MAVKVIYFSRGGSTEKVAKEIASVFKADIRKAGDIKRPEQIKSELLFIGSGNYSGHPSKHIRSLIEGLGKKNIKRAAVFGTYGGDWKAIAKMEAMLKEKKIRVVGHFGCKGKFFILRRGKPEEKDLDRARKFAINIRRRFRIRK